MKAKWLWCALLVCAGCGYRAGFALRDGASVGATIFDNTSREPDLEVDWHAALTDALQRMVDAPLSSAEAADYRIDGRIVEYRRLPGVRAKDNVRLGSGVRITVAARLVRGARLDTRGAATPDVLREVTVREERGFHFADPAGEALARAEVLRALADRVLIDLFGDLAWSRDSAVPR